MSLEAMIERVAKRGLQLQRKDKDLMSDTGGVSKGREREPEIRPSREENKRPFRKKDKPAEVRDSDTDNDHDKVESKGMDRDLRRKSSIRRAMIDLKFNKVLQETYTPHTLHPLDRTEQSNFGFPIPENNYYHRVWSALTNIITSNRGISEKAFSAYEEVMAEVDAMLRTPEVMEVVDRFEEGGYRPEFCAESLYGLRME